MGSHCLLVSPYILALHSGLIEHLSQEQNLMTDHFMQQVVTKDTSSGYISGIGGRSEQMTTNVSVRLNLSALFKWVGHIHLAVVEIG